jgi:hypothetical protein
VRQEFRDGLPHGIGYDRIAGSHAGERMRGIHV